MTVALTSYTPCPLFDWLRILRFARLFVPLPPIMGFNRIYYLILCAVLALTVGCTGNGTSNDEEVKATWQRYHEAYRAKDLNRALSILDSMETEKIISTPKADYLRGLNYDQGWQMKIAEHLYKKAYEGYTSDPSQDWYTYTDAGYRWACLRFIRQNEEQREKLRKAGII